LVDEVVLAQIVCLLGVGACGVLLPNSLRFFLVDPESLHAFVYGISFHKTPRFQVGQHPKMLGYSWRVYFFLKINNIATEISLLIKSLGDE